MHGKIPSFEKIELRKSLQFVIPGSKSIRFRKLCKKRKKNSNLMIMKSPPPQRSPSNDKTY